MNKIFSYIKSNFFVKISIVICLILTLLFGLLFFLSEENTSNDIENLRSQGYLSDDIGIEFYQFNLTRLSSGTLFSDQKKRVRLRALFYWDSLVEINTNLIALMSQLQNSKSQKWIKNCQLM